MEKEEVLRILKSIYASLTYNDWFHAKEFVKLEIEKLEKIVKNK